MQMQRQCQDIVFVMYLQLGKERMGKGCALIWQRSKTAYCVARWVTTELRADSPS